LNSGAPVTTAENLSAYSEVLTSDTASNLFLLREKQNVEIESAKVATLKSQNKPNFYAGYALQNFEQGGWLNGAQLGISFPLFKGQNKRYIQAQKIQIQIANYNYENKSILLNQELLDIENTMSVYKAGINYYNEQLQSVNPEILRISELNYQAGELSYLELLNTLQLVATNNQKYWEQVLAYNKAVANYKFLTTK
jgi:cobalt-zinc-cadmium resistance protein CzcA